MIPGALTLERLCLLTVPVVCFSRPDRFSGHLYAESVCRAGADIGKIFCRSFVWTVMRQSVFGDFLPLNLGSDFLMIPSPTVLKCPDLHIFLRPRGAYWSARKYRSVCRVAIGRPMKSACNSSGFASRYYPNFRGFFLRCRRKMIPSCDDRRAPSCFDFPGPAVQILVRICLFSIRGAVFLRFIVSLNRGEFLL